MVPKKISDNKLKLLRGAPILHRGDLKTVPGLLNCLKKFFKLQISLVTFSMCPSSVVFYDAKGRGKGSPSPQLVQGVEIHGPLGEAPGGS